MYDVDYTDEGDVLQHEHVTADEISAVDAPNDGDEDESGERDEDEREDEE